MMLPWETSLWSTPLACIPSSACSRGVVHFSRQITTRQAAVLAGMSYWRRSSAALYSVLRLPEPSSLEGHAAFKHLLLGM